MQINFLDNLTRIQAQDVRAKEKKFQPEFGSPLESSPVQDVFIKSVNKTAPIDKTALKKSSLQEIYDKTYEEVLAQNPITKELNITKPKLKRITDKQDADFDEKARASYNILYNTIQIYNNPDDDFLLLYSEYEGGTKVPYTVATVDEYQNDPNLEGYKTIKLNDKEKELYISSILAHELRHFIQEHLILSTKGCEDARKYDMQNVLRAKESTEKLIRLYESSKADCTLESEKEEIDAEIKELKKDIEDFSYVLNYKPKKLLDDNAKLGFKGNNPADDKFFSVKEHFAKSKIIKRTDEDAYNYEADPAEIDAHMYQGYFINKKINSLPEECREDVCTMLAIQPIIYHTDEDLMVENGYIPTIKGDN